MNELKHQKVKNLYSNFIPFPGDYIRLLEEKNIFKKWFYTFLTKRFILTQKKARVFVQQRFSNVDLDFDAAHKIIDIGCGTGEKTIKYALAFPNSEVLGIDFAETSLCYAKRLQDHLDITNLEFRKFDLLNDDFRKLGQFDILQSGGVIHHTDDPCGILKNIRNYLMHEDSIMWIYLYSKYGKKHIEENVRLGLESLIPDDDQLEARMLLLENLNIDDKYLAEFTKKDNFLDIIKQAYFKVRTLGDYSYTRQEQQKIADSYIHPKSIKYDSKMLEELFEEAALELFEFLVLPDIFGIRNNQFLAEILDNKKTNIYQRLHIHSSFIVAANYYLILRKKR